MNYQIGDQVLFNGKRPWTVNRIVAVTDPWDGDPEYTQRLGLTRTEPDGFQNYATGIRNTEVRPTH